MNPTAAWFQGQIVDEAGVHIPAQSLTVTQGVAVFESLRLVDGAAPLVERHARRLAEGCARAGWTHANQDWGAILRALCAERGQREGRARILVGDGFALVTCGPLPADLERERSEGVGMSTLALGHATHGFKSASRLALWLAEREAGGEVALRDAHGALLETTRANLFAAADTRLWTADESRVLPGIARGLVIELAHELGLDIVAQPPELRRLPQNTELFATNAVRGVRPVARLDGRPLHVPLTPTSTTRRLQRALDEKMGLAL
jgi:branched-subunit amino acid aminotransferase/4-amino-4-deoxychorismate lyase